MTRTALRSAIPAWLLAAPILAGCARPEMPRSPDDGSSRWAAVGEPAPEIALRSMDGGTQRLSHYAGQVVIVTFWTTFCGPCRLELPHLEALRERHGDVVVLGVSLDGEEDDEDVRDVADRLHLAFPILRDPDGRAAFEYMKFAMTPLTAVVGRDGRLRAVYRGFGPGLPARLEQDVEAALGDPPPRAS